MKGMVIALIVLAIVAIVTTGAVVWKGMDSMADIATSPIVLVGALVAGIALALAVSTSVMSSDKPLATYRVLPSG